MSLELYLVASIAVMVILGLVCLWLALARHGVLKAARLNERLTNLEPPASAAARLARSKMRAAWLVTDDPNPPEPSRLDRWDGRCGVPTEIVMVPRKGDRQESKNGGGASL
jgi:hypothetical protein